ncbi:glycosyltransferase family 2 protein [Phosphitispora fastidiosa]|uniref:glycosyltransferase family 2 protein n=1 Tax=Phosphitispora fastidiosa TaxID=2837202 RepID=UPI001E329694|nr:glycosyltransferase family A protein [Phosphitispora fastidiosa]MBU7008561.1 glycosyltransferase involved in cell wall biosynthesis [Phosphitispora fastidiosa]
MMNGEKPLVTIGLPVYNGERFLRLALESLLAQDYENFELIISDNASTDTTAEICHQYRVMDKRIRYVRNDTNLGAAKNFNRVFELSVGKYFMWAAHDNLWDKTYISKCVATLEENPTAVLCFCGGIYINEAGGYRSSYKNVGTMGMDIPARIHAQTVSNSNGCPVYGLIRPGVLKQTRLFTDMFAHDFILLVELSLLGEFVMVPEILISIRLRDRPKSVQEYQESINPGNVKPLPAPFTENMRELLRLVSRANLSESDKQRIFSDLVENLINTKWRTLIFRENKLDLASPQLRDDLKRILLAN